jgi:hypothetical protein
MKIINKIDADLKPHHISIFYVGGSTGWGVAKFTKDETQVGSAEFTFHKANARIIAAQLRKEKDMPIYNFNMSGRKVNEL